MNTAFNPFFKLHTSTYPTTYKCPSFGREVPDSDTFHFSGHTTAVGPTEKYSRRKHYPNTPTRSDRLAILGKELFHSPLGRYWVVDHDPPLAVRWFLGDPKKGEKPGYMMTQAERNRSARDRSRMKPMRRQESGQQGAETSRWVAKQHKKYNLFA